MLAALAHVDKSPAGGCGAPRGGEIVSLESEVTDLLNRHSAENASDTPDFVLAEFLLRCLTAFDLATVKRDSWYGRDPKSARSTGGSGPVPQPGGAP